MLSKDIIVWDTGAKAAIIRKDGDSRHPKSVEEGWGVKNKSILQTKGKRQTRQDDNNVNCPHSKMRRSE